jgi:glucosylceramidase
MKKIVLFFGASILASGSFAQTNTTVEVYTTADSTKFRLSKTATLNFVEKSQPFENEITVFVDPSKTFQSYMGIGGAITDAAAETFYKLPENKRKELLNAYYSATNGIGYTIARTNINSCDFSSDMYTYVNENDKSLNSFSVEHDKKYKIPFLKEANIAAANKLTIFRFEYSHCLTFFFATFRICKR